MYIVQGTHPDVPLVIVPPTVVDAEGTPVADAGALEYDVTVDNPDAVNFTPNDAGDPLNPGTVSFGTADPATGAPRVGQIVVLVKSAANGTVLGSLGAQVTVTAGDAAQIQGGSLTLGDLVES